MCSLRSKSHSWSVSTISSSHPAAWTNVTGVSSGYWFINVSLTSDARALLYSWHSNTGASPLMPIAYPLTAASIASTTASDGSRSA